MIRKILKNTLIAITTIAVALATVPPTRIYAKDFTVYADAGHGCIYQTAKTKGPYGFAALGAEGEAAYTSAFTKYYIQSSSHIKGMNVKSISDLSLKGVQGSNALFGNSGRSQLFNASDCDIMIQFHYDKVTEESTNGGHVIYSNNSKDSIILAFCIATAMKANGCRMNDYYPLNISERHELSSYNKALNKPLVLIELGMGVPGEPDADYLRDPKTMKLLTDSVNQGIASYRQLVGK